MIRSLACCLPLLLAAVAGAAENAFFVQVTQNERAVLAHRDGSIQLLGLPALETLGRFGEGRAGPLEAVAVSASGRWLAAGYPDRGLEVWDLGSGELRLTVPRASSKSKEAPVFLFEPRHDLLLVSQGEELQLWDPEHGALARTIGSIRAVKMSVSPDGLFLAVAGWCRTGCGDYDLCVYGLGDDLVLAGGHYDLLLEEAGRHEIHDLAYLGDNQIVVESGVTAFDDPVAWMLPATLQVRAVSIAPSAQASSYPSIRSAPRPQYLHTSLDGLWMIRLSPERGRLYLYRREAAQGPESEFELEKFVRLP